MDYEQLQQEESLYPWINDSVDFLDAMADRFEELQEAMRESEEFEWDGIEEISSAERNACDHYNERYVIND